MVQRLTNTYHKFKFKIYIFNLPSPKPKQGIKLSSSKGAKALPTIVIACSYGFGTSPILCRLCLLKDFIPNMFQTCNY
jgi:hypothetical protein